MCLKQLYRIFDQLLAFKGKNCNAWLVKHGNAFTIQHDFVVDRKISIDMEVVASRVCNKCFMPEMNIVREELT